MNLGGAFALTTAVVGGTTYLFAGGSERLRRERLFRRAPTAR